MNIHEHPVGIARHDDGWLLEIWWTVTPEEVATKQAAMVEWQRIIAGLRVGLPARSGVFRHQSGLPWPDREHYAGMFDPLSLHPVASQALMVVEAARTRNNIPPNMYARCPCGTVACDLHPINLVAITNLAKEV